MAKAKEKPEVTEAYQAAQDYLAALDGIKIATDALRQSELAAKDAANLLQKFRGDAPESHWIVDGSVVVCTPGNVRELGRPADGS